MKALVFAAGLGTRLRPLTDDRPKALVEVEGRPLLEITLDNLVSYGFTDIVINIHYFGEQIKEFVSGYLSRRGDPCGGRIRIAFSEEFDLLRDTGGGIRHARPLLDDGEPFLVHNVDIISDINLRALYGNASAAEASDPDNIATVVVSGRYSDRRLLFDEAMRLKGWENVVSHQVKSPFEEIARYSGNEKAHEILSGGGLSPFAFAGIHVLSPRVFGLLDRFAAEYGAENGEKFPIMDFYLKYAGDYTVRGRFFNNLRLMDVGKIGHLGEAGALLRQIESERANKR